MRWKGRKRSDNVEDRRGMSTKGKLVTGGGAVALIVLLLQFFGGETGQQLAPIVKQLGNGQGTQQVEQRDLTPEEIEMGNFVATVLADTETAWSTIFTNNNLGDYREPTLVLFTDAVQTGCGNASAASGPFYCPADQKLYMDMAFFEVLKQQFGAKGGDFAIAYVIAHEIGHHVQTLVGTSQKVRQLQSQSNRTQANKLSVALELQADFYAGVWAHYNKRYLEEGDIGEAISAANAVGDDALQKKMGGEVNPKSFTHGTSQQRITWFKKGYNTGNIQYGDTFAEVLD